MDNFNTIHVYSSSEVEREGLCRILRSHEFNVTGHDLNDQLYNDDERRNDSAIALISEAPGEQSFDFCRQVKSRSPDSKVVIFSSDCRSSAIVTAFKADIDGYIDKQTSCEGLAKMLTLVALGEKVIPSQPFLEMQIANNDIVAHAMPVAADGAELSERELDVLRGLIRGDPNKTIARQSAITEATVKVHVKSILRKVGALNRTQAAIWGLSRGIGATPQRQTKAARLAGSMG